MPHASLNLFKETKKLIMTNSHAIALKFSAILWVIWGIVHTLAGFLTITLDSAASVQGIADAVDPALLAIQYPAAVEGLLNQHGFNLAWFGIATIIGAIFIWRSNRTAIWVTAMVGGLADLGYFLFLDLGGFVNFVPGSVMTIVSSAAIISSVWVWFSTRG